MSAVGFVAAAGVGCGCAGVAACVRPPTRRLAPRVRPYLIVARAALGHPADPPSTSAMRGLFGPPGRALHTRVTAALGSRRDDELAHRLRQAGFEGRTPEQHRVRQTGDAFAWAAAAALITALTLHRPALVVCAAVAAFVHGATRASSRLERAIAARADRMRLELTTINQLIAMHVRTGAGPMQAVQRVVARGRGAVVDELREVLTWTRAGMGEAEAFRHAAELTPEPSAARTYRLLAAGVERGVDLAGALLALSADIRDARREQLHKDAVRRRAAMLVPTIAVLAPIMLLFIAAPLPSIVLGHR